MLGARSVVVFPDVSSGAADARFATSAARILVFVAVTASGGSPAMRADSSPRPLDRARVIDNHVIVFSFVVSVFLDIPPNVV